MKKEKMKVLERESFTKLCNDFQGFLDMMVLPMFADGKDEDEKIYAYNAVVRQGLTDLKDFLRNISLVPQLACPEDSKQ